jgi:hypothetical protein
MNVSSLRSTECGAKGQGDYTYKEALLPLYGQYFRETVIFGGQISD